MIFNYGARWYDPAAGRFTTVDPLATMFSPTSPYVYTLNNPLKYIDPTGMATEESKAAKEDVDYEARYAESRAFRDRVHGELGGEGSSKSTFYQPNFFPKNSKDVPKSSRADPPNKKNPNSGQYVGNSIGGFSITISAGGVGKTNFVRTWGLAGSNDNWYLFKTKALDYYGFNFGISFDLFGMKKEGGSQISISEDFEGNGEVFDYGYAWFSTSAIFNLNRYNPSMCNAESSLYGGQLSATLGARAGFGVGNTYTTVLASGKLTGNAWDSTFKLKMGGL